MVRALRLRVMGSILMNSAVSASIGIFLGQGGNNPDGLLRAADAAMYHAKRSGREKYTFFSELPMAEAQSS